MRTLEEIEEELMDFSAVELADLKTVYDEDDAINIYFLQSTRLCDVEAMTVALDAGADLYYEGSDEIFEGETALDAFFNPEREIDLECFKLLVERGVTKNTQIRRATVWELAQELEDTEAMDVLEASEAAVKAGTAYKREENQSPSPEADNTASHFESANYDVVLESNGEIRARKRSDDEDTNLSGEYFIVQQDYSAVKKYAQGYGSFQSEKTIRAERSFFVGESHFVMLLSHTMYHYEGSRNKGDPMCLFPALIMFNLANNTKKEFRLAFGFNDALFLEDRYLLLASSGRVVDVQNQYSKVVLLDLNPTAPQEIFLDGIKNVGWTSHDNHFRLTEEAPGHIPPEWATCKLFNDSVDKGIGCGPSGGGKVRKSHFRFAQLPDSQLATFNVDENAGGYKFIVWDAPTQTKVRTIIVPGMVLRWHPPVPYMPNDRRSVSPTWYHLSDVVAAVVDLDDDNCVHKVNLITGECEKHSQEILKGHRSLPCDLIQTSYLPTINSIIDLNDGMFATTHIFTRTGWPANSLLAVSYVHIWDATKRIRIADLAIGINTVILTLKREGDVLLVNGERWNIKTQKCLDTSPDYWQRKLFVAAFMGDVELVQLCLKNGAQADKPHESGPGVTALSFATSEYREGVMRLLGGDNVESEVVDMKKRRKIDLTSFASASLFGGRTSQMPPDVVSHAPVI